MPQVAFVLVESMIRLLVAARSTLSLFKNASTAYHEMRLIAVRPKKTPVLIDEGMIRKNLQHRVASKKELKGPAAPHFDMDCDQRGFLEKLVQFFIEPIRALDVPPKILGDLRNLGSGAGRIIHIAAGNYDRFALYDAPGTLQVQRKLSDFF